MFIVALFIIAKIWKQPKCSSTSEDLKRCYIYTVEYYSTKKKKDKILPFVIIWMGMEGIMLSEISPTEKDKYCVTSLKWNMRN